MDESVALILLLAIGFIGLVLIPLGLPGLWVILLGIIGYGWYTDFDPFGLWFLIAEIGLAFLGEVLESWIGFRFARRYGGSRRAGWGALIGGIVGAIVGVPILLIGSVIGGFVGAFLGATLFEYTHQWRAEGSVRAGWGAVLGRAVAAALKIGIGVVMMVLAIVVALFSGWQGS
ncbi:MAG TPA: DUF456 domain-containing protein [Gemmatimonadales bacterium]|nr:DUF456 domain-containing protein [Gemmatimonadales bacterium]